MKALDIQVGKFYRVSLPSRSFIIFIIDKDYFTYNEDIDPPGTKCENWTYWDFGKKTFDSFIYLNKTFIDNMKVIDNPIMWRNLYTDIASDFEKYKSKTLRCFDLLKEETIRFRKENVSRIPLNGSEPILEEIKTDQPILYYDKTYISLKYLVEVSGESQKSLIKSGSKTMGMSVKQWCKEFCTIRLSASRRCGHTTAIIRLVKEKFNKVALLVPSYRMSNISNAKGISDKIIYLPISKYNDIRGMNEEIEAVIVDCASWNLTKNSEEKIYETFYPFIRKDEKFFIFVG